MPVSEAFPLTGEGRLPLSGGDVERSETEGVGEHGEAVTDEGEKNLLFTPQFFCKGNEEVNLFSGEAFGGLKESVGVAGGFQVGVEELFWGDVEVVADVEKQGHRGITDAVLQICNITGTLAQR